MSECRSNPGTALNPPEFFPAVRMVPLTRNGHKTVMYPIGIACWQTVRVRARAADPFPLHDGRALARGGQVPGQEFPARAAAENEGLI